MLRSACQAGSRPTSPPEGRPAVSAIPASADRTAGAKAFAIVSIPSTLGCSRSARQKRRLANTPFGKKDAQSTPQASQARLRRIAGDASIEDAASRPVHPQLSFQYCRETSRRLHPISGDEAVAEREDQRRTTGTIEAGRRRSRNRRRPTRMPLLRGVKRQRRRLPWAVCCRSRRYRPAGAGGGPPRRGCRPGRSRTALLRRRRHRPSRDDRRSRGVR